MQQKLEEKINKARQVIRDAAEKYREELFVAWTGGKDSTVLLSLVREEFNGQVPMAVFFNDSTMEFPEVYEFIERLTKEWELNLVVERHRPQELAQFAQAKEEDQKRLSRLMKVEAIKRAVVKHQVKAFMAAIRWDEHQSRAQEEYFSKREDHVRIHPILHFLEKDIWNYIRAFQVPYVSLYDQGYRSLGEAPFTKPAAEGGGERSGREEDKEKLMEELRNMGYW